MLELIVSYIYHVENQTSAILVYENLRKNAEERLWTCNVNGVMDIDKENNVVFYYNYFKGKVSNCNLIHFLLD